MSCLFATHYSMCRPELQGRHYLGHDHQHHNPLQSNRGISAYCILISVWILTPLSSHFSARRRLRLGPDGGCEQGAGSAETLLHPGEAVPGPEPRHLLPRPPAPAHLLQMRHQEQDRGRGDQGERDHQHIRCESASWSC